MRGNQRTSGDLSRREGGKIFGSGSRTPIAITILVKKPQKGDEKAKIFYHDIGDYLTREDKLNKIKAFGSILSPEMELASITPSNGHDWINKKDDLFQTFIPLGDKKNEEVKTIFVPFYSCGIQSNRDIWVYNYSRKTLLKNSELMVNTYNSQVDRLAHLNKSQIDNGIDGYVDTDESKIKWSSSLISYLSRKIKGNWSNKYIVDSMYRPFCKQFLYFEKIFIHRPYQIPKLFPDPQSKNLIICVPGIGSTKDLSVLIVDSIPDVQLQYNGQCFPLYYYEKNDSQQSDLYASSQDEYIRHDGISDFALNLAKELNPKISKEDIFYYIYGFLHNPEYRTRFAADLKKSLPRIFFPATYEEFKKYRKAGHNLAKLHLNYESGPLCPSVIVSGCEHGNFKVDKMRFIAKDDKRTIIFNNDITIENIPQEAYNYVINGKSAIEWIMERYAVTIDKNSKIVNDPNQWSEDPRYVLDLLLRIIQMSLETLKIVNKLPKLNLPS